MSTKVFTFERFIMVDGDLSRGNISVITELSYNKLYLFSFFVNAA